MRRLSLNRQREDRAAKVPLQVWQGKQTWRCAVTYKRTGPIWVHHIAHPSRKQLPANWLLLGDVVHRHYHGERELGCDGQRLPKLLPGHLLWCKLTEDPEHFDLDVILQLKGWKGLPEHWELRELETAFMEERERNA